jgi:hypothetical protein
MNDQLSLHTYGLINQIGKNNKTSGQHANMYEYGEAFLNRQMI